MPMTPAKLRSRVKLFEFDYDGDAIHVGYRPAFINQESVPKLNAILARINAAADANDEAAGEVALAEFGEWVATWLESWDFLEDDGETMQAITPENLARLMLEYTGFIMAVFMAVIEDTRDSKHSAPASSELPGATLLPMGSRTNSTPAGTTGSRKNSNSSSLRAG